MSFKEIRHLFPFCFLLPLLITTAFIPDADAQNWRASAGYTIQGYSISATPFSDNGDAIPSTQKGLLELELERYLLYRLYLSMYGEALLHNTESVFLGGPVNFNQAGFGTRLGVQWSRLGIHAGIQAGSVWNMSFTGERDGQTNPVQMRADGRTGSLYGGYSVGAKYYLNRYVRLTAELRNQIWMNGRFEAPAEAGFTPVAQSADFGNITFSAGFSISIPFRTRGRLNRVEERDRLPLLMEASGVRFDAPMDRETFVTSPFGQRWGRPHQGVDLQADRGDAVLAAASGVVVEAGVASGYGNLVVIRHGSSYTTHYAHLDRIRVREGDTVRRGDRIGTAGDTGVATGVHLHFEIRRDGEPVDPTRYIRF